MTGHDIDTGDIIYVERVRNPSLPWHTGVPCTTDQVAAVREDGVILEREGWVAFDDLEYLEVLS